MMLEQSLSGAHGVWQFREVGEGEWLPAEVPGCNYNDLLVLGKIPDPFIGLNEEKSKWVGEKDWEYRRFFSAEKTLLKMDEIFLHCEMLDTLCKVYVNDTLVGKGKNMHLVYDFPVKKLLREGENELRIVFFSPIQFVRHACETDPTPGNSQSITGMTHIRKAQCHFGWDWGPTIPISGITRDISLRGYETARILETRILQNHHDGVVDVTIRTCARLLTGSSDKKLLFVFTLLSPSGEMLGRRAVEGPEAECAFTIENPQLWWTNDLSDEEIQPLYTVKAELCEGEKALDAVSKRIGLRTIILNQEKDQWGYNFQFILNGVPLFAKGGDYIPMDSLITRAGDDKKRALLQDCRHAHMNCIRIWGGGYYESDAFYDLCDEYGILVWQDFMFACAPYPFYDDEFLENVKAEIVCNVRRLRDHACLALWCGNNEIEDMSMGWKTYRKLTQWTEIFFYQILPDFVKALDDRTPFISGSPCGTGYMKDIHSDNVGDTHLWQVWHGLQPLNFYRRHLTRFCSEFGLESMPSITTVNYFAKPEEQALTSPVFNAHQKSPSGNRKMIYYIASQYLLPDRFDDLLYLTQMIQLEGVRDATEHWRRNRGRCNGSLYWQLNDCWPVCSWAGIDYFGRFKALHYGARRFNKPVMVSIEDTKDELKLFVINDKFDSFTGSLSCKGIRFDGTPIYQQHFTVSVPATDVARVVRMECKAILRGTPRSECVFVAQLNAADGTPISRKTVLFEKERDCRLPDCKYDFDVSVEGGQASVTVSSDTFARSLFVYSPLFTGNLTDNFFDLLPGERVTLVSPVQEGTTADALRESLLLRSVGNITEVQPRWKGLLQALGVKLIPANFVNWIYRAITG